MGNTENSIYLHGLLDEAVKLSSEFSGGYSNHFLSAQEFHLALKESVTKLKNGDRSQLQILWRWFAPTCDWDDLIGIDGANLGNEIFENLYKDSTL